MNMDPTFIFLIFLNLKIEKLLVPTFFNDQNQKTSKPNFQKPLKNQRFSWSNKLRINGFMESYWISS
jgi:hypothetical protein